MNYQERLFRQRWGYECEPTTLLAVSLALSAAGTAATMQGQKASAASQQDYQNKLVNANNAEANLETSSLRIQQAQTSEASVREMEKARLATQKASSTATVAAGESGVTGASVDAVLNEYQINLGQYREATMRQGTLNAFATDAKVAATTKQAGYDALKINSPVQGPNYLAEGLKFGGNALSAFHAYSPDSFKKTG